MKDRVPTYPGRVVLTPVSGAANTFDMTLADEAVEDGTPLNEQTLLQDSTAASLGLGEDATPDDALKVIISKQATQIQYSTVDLTPGVSNLVTGTLYVVYE